MSKIAKKFNDYISIYDKGVNFDAGAINKPNHDPSGVTALKAFLQKESFGKDVSTSEPELLYKALVGKTALNLQIDSWVQHWCMSKEEVYELELPEWCYDTLRQSLKKRYKVLTESDTYKTFFEHEDILDVAILFETALLRRGVQ